MVTKECFTSPWNPGSILKNSVGQVLWVEGEAALVPPARLEASGCAPGNDYICSRILGIFFLIQEVEEQTSNCCGKGICSSMPERDCLDFEPGDRKIFSCTEPHKPC